MLEIKKENFYFDKNTIERSVLFVLNKYDSIKNKDQEYIQMLDVYTNNYVKIEESKIIAYSKIPAISNPFNYIATELMTNIINHVNLNFKRFQKIYVKIFVYELFNKYNFKKPLLCSIVNLIMYHVNEKKDKLVIYSKKIANLSNLNELVPLMKTLIEKLKNEIPEKIKDKIVDYNLKSNYVEVLKYYYNMLGYLELNNLKRFSLLPQLSLKYSYIRFDSRFISTIYDESQPKENKVGIKYFEANYKKYYKKCFKFDKLKYNKTSNPISFLTNGYSVCVNMEIKKRLVEPKIKNKLEKITTTKKIITTKKIDLNIEQINKKFKKGIYESENCLASNDTLNKYHKIGIDPGNDSLLYCVSETGNIIDIRKSYYNEISHITKNTIKMKNHVKKHNMHDLYNLLAESGYKKTLNIEKYSKFITIIRSNWDKLFDFYKRNEIQKLELDTFINKKKAIHKIVRKIVPKNNKLHKFKKNNKLLCNELEYNKIIKKPTMLAFGKGNGNITIANLKNKGPTGPIKTLAKELGKFTMTVLVDEYNTSQVCPICKECKVEHPIMDHKYKNSNKIRSKETYKLCYCSNNKKHPLNVDDNKLWFNRDYCGGLNQIHKMKLVLTNTNLGLYTRIKMKPQLNICWTENVSV